MWCGVLDRIWGHKRRTLAAPVTQGGPHPKVEERNTGFPKTVQGKFSPGPQTARPGSERAQRWPCFGSEFEGPGIQGRGDQSLAALTGYDCVIWSLKSRPHEVIASCSPGHLPKIAVTSERYKEDSSLRNHKEHPTLSAQPLRFCAA